LKIEDVTKKQVKAKTLQVLLEKYGDQQYNKYKNNLNSNPASLPRRERGSRLNKLLPTRNLSPCQKDAFTVMNPRNLNNIT
jgi:hypothetical protein